MATYQYRTLRYADDDVWQRLKDIASKSGRTAGNINVSCALWQQPKNNKLDQFERDKELTGILPLKSALLSSVQVHFDGSSIAYNRNNNELFDTVRIETGGDTALAIALLPIAKQHFEETILDKSGFQYLDEMGRAHFAAREQALKALQDVVDTSIRKQQEFFHDLGKQYQDKHDKLEADTTAKKQELQKDHDDKLASLKKAQDDFEERRKQFDDRESRLLRRKLMDDLKDFMKQRTAAFSLSERTQKKRWLSIGLYATLLVVFAGLAIYYFFFVPTVEGLEWVGYIRQGVCVLAFATTVGFCLRWQNSYFKSHADEEFRLKRLELDIFRSGMVIEMAMEWASEHKGELPQYFIEILCKNLFVEVGSEPDGAMSAADALASAIMNSATKLKLNIAGNEVELTHKGIETLAKTEVKGD